MARAAQPFPWSAVPAVPRSEVALGRAAMRSLAPAPCLPDEVLGAGWAALLGVSARAAPGVARVAEPPRDGFTAVFAHDDGEVVLATMDRPLARALAARALGAAPSPDGPITPAEEGALAALAVKAAALACAPATPPRLRAVTDDLDDARRAMRRDAPAVCWPWAVSAPPLAGTVTLCLTPRPRAPQPFAHRDAVRAAAVTVLVVGARSPWPAAEVAALRAGEVLALDGLSDERGALRGAVDLALGTPEGPRFSATLTPRGARIDAPAALGDTVTHDPDDARTAPMHRAVLDAIPVEVTVEIARATATVAEVSAWRPGEVVPFATPVGAAVLVRAGGRPVARGELVDVEGSVGVRVTEVL